LRSAGVIIVAIESQDRIGRAAVSQVDSTAITVNAERHENERDCPGGARPRDNGDGNHRGETAANGRAELKAQRDALYRASVPNNSGVKLRVHRKDDALAKAGADHDGPRRDGRISGFEKPENREGQQDAERGTREVNAAAPDYIRKPTCGRYGKHLDQSRKRDHRKNDGTRHAELLSQIGHGEHGQDADPRHFRDFQADRDDRLAPVFGQRLDHRDFDSFLVLPEFQELRRLIDLNQCQRRRAPLRTAFLPGATTLLVDAR
jgi:hypothetical protein